MNLKEVIVRFKSINAFNRYFYPHWNHDKDVTIFREE
jgi:hypothetical protein